VKRWDAWDEWDEYWHEAAHGSENWYKTPENEIRKGFSSAGFGDSAVRHNTGRTEEMNRGIRGIRGRQIWPEKDSKRHGFWYKVFGAKVLGGE
jgi:hypothetical protein